ncbi:amidohydrolase [Marinobacter sp. GN3S48]|uniref:amidohydrolase n=1 Tax=Marinobacter sp. GN3S48 TaxID=3382302 RepID=UPI00387A89DF
MTKTVSSEKLFINGRIYTVNAEAPWVDAMLVRDGVIQALGSDRELRNAVGSEVEVVDLEGRMLMPGIHDAHIHLLMSGLKFGFECRVSMDANADQVAEQLCDCLKCRSSKLSNWVIGGEFNPYAFEEGTLDRAALDQKFPDRPVYLFDYSIHHALVNSKALELAGINASTPDPRGGRFVRRTGSDEPTGELVERARWPVSRVIPPYEPDIYRDALRWSQEMAHRFGITSVQEASASLPELKALRELEEADELKMHVAAHLVWEEVTFAGGLSCEEQEGLIASRSDHKSRHVNTRFVKCWLDGAPLGPHFTEARIDAASNRIDQDKILIPEDQLTEALMRFDRDGITLKMHCAGEGAVRTALNAVERVRAANGNDGPLHEIAHAGFVHPDDRPRLARLRVVAEMSPALWHRKEPEFEPLKAGFKFNTLDAMGTHITIGSDWIITPDPNLFPALQGMLERGDESVDLRKALRMMTLDGARAVGQEKQIGSLEVGKAADFIILDRNLFEIPTSDVGETRVLSTYFAGDRVYSA